MRVVAVFMCLLMFSFESYAKTSENLTEQMVPVVVPKKGGIGYGTIIGYKTMRYLKLPKSSLPKNYIHKDKIHEINGKTVNRFIEGGQPLTSSDIAHFPMQPEIDSLIKAQEKIDKIIVELKGCVPRCEEKYKKLIGEIEL